MQGSLPESLILPSRIPQAVQAFRRRFVSPSTNVSAAGPDDYVNIYPDTSTPGAFIDTKSTYFMMDFEVINNNFMVDYANWGLGGVGGAIIQDFKVNNQGSLLEDIAEYGTVQEAYNVMEAEIQQETHLYFSNRLKNGYVGSAHKNFIKPPMCDASGNIMFALNPFGLGFDPNVTQAPTIYANNSDGGFVMNQPVASQSGAITIGGGINLPAGVSPVYTNAANAEVQPSWGKGGVDFGGANTAPLLTPSAADWPDFYSSSQSEIVRRNFVREYGSINKPQIMANLANVKCFPIGMAPGDDCYSSGNGYGRVKPDLYTQGLEQTKTSATNQPVARSNKIRVCYQPLSGIIGKLAPKMLATTLLAPQQMYFTLHFAQAAIALNLSSDPCRRISNTIRDYVRNIGTQNGQVWGTQTFAVADPALPYVITQSTFAMGYSPALSPPLGTLNAIFTEAAASGKVTYSGSEYPAAATPQYALTKTPWEYKPRNDLLNNKAINYAVDTEVFYGTYLKASVPQSKRIFQFADAAGTNSLTRVDGSGSYPNNGTLTTYRVSNIALVGDQVILPDNITDLVVRDAAQGNFSVMTNSVRTYQMPVLQSETQSIIIPAKVAMARQLTLIFQNQEQRSGNLGYYYNSNCGYNPFASLVAQTPINASITGYISTSADPTKIFGVGMRDPLVYTPTTTQAGSKAFQLVIGSDNFPPSPLTTLQEMSAEMTKTMKGWVDAKYSPDYDAMISQSLGNGSVYAGGSLGTDVPVYDCITGGSYATAFINANLLDDQTIVSNYDFVPLYGKNGALAPQNGLTSTDVSNGYNYLCPRGHCVNGVFTVPEGRFMLSTNLARFIDGDTTSGMYLGNNVITAKLSGAVALASGAWRCIAVIPHEAQLTYMAGGQLLWNY